MSPRSQKSRPSEIRVGGLVCQNGVLSLPVSPFEHDFLTEAAKQQVGFLVAHAHIDRADTTPPEHFAGMGTNAYAAAALSLASKRDMLGSFHGGIYSDPVRMHERLEKFFQRMIAYGITRIHTCIDTTPDLPDRGLYAMQTVREVAKKFSGSLDVRLGPHPVFGLFKGDRWEIFEEAAKQADFVTGLPERDDHRRCFEHHVRRVLELAVAKKVEAHFHVDQTGDPLEQGSQRVINVIKTFHPEQLRVADKNVLVRADTHPTKPRPNPMVWLVHALSVAALPESEFRALVDDLLACNVGVIVCPSATLSNRQLRPLTAPIHNSITRMLELAVAGVPIRLGPDNISDYLVPWCSGNMMSEIVIAGTVLRFASPRVLAKLACGVPLDNFDREAIREVLGRDYEAFRRIDSSWRPAINLG